MAEQMTAFRLSRLLGTDAALYLVSGCGTETHCTVRMTASKPKKVNRSIVLSLVPERTFLLCEQDGILWTKDVQFSCDADGAPCADVTDILRALDVSFAFCEPSTFRRCKAYPRELERMMDFDRWGRRCDKDCRTPESPAGVDLAFFPDCLTVCSAAIRRIRLAGFAWSPESLDRALAAMTVPCHVDEQTACRLLAEQGPLTGLEIVSDRMKISAEMFFRSGFYAAGFGKRWERRLHSAMFQENGCAPCKTERFAPLLCRLLEAADAAAVEAALQWGAEAQILR